MPASVERKRRAPAYERRLRLGLLVRGERARSDAVTAAEGAGIYLGRDALGDPHRCRRPPLGLRWWERAARRDVGQPVDVRACVRSSATRDAKADVGGTIRRPAGRVARDRGRQLLVRLLVLLLENRVCRLHRTLLRRPQAHARDHAPPRRSRHRAPRIRADGARALLLLWQGRPAPKSGEARANSHAFLARPARRSVLPLRSRTTRGRQLRRLRGVQVARTNGVARGFSWIVTGERRCADRVPRRAAATRNAGGVQ